MPVSFLDTGFRREPVANLLPLGNGFLRVDLDQATGEYAVVGTYLKSNGEYHRAPTLAFRGDKTKVFAPGERAELALGTRTVSVQATDRGTFVGPPNGFPVTFSGFRMPGDRGERASQPTPTWITTNVSEVEPIEDGFVVTLLKPMIPASRDVSLAELGLVTATMPSAHVLHKMLEITHLAVSSDGKNAKPCGYRLEMEGATGKVVMNLMGGAVTRFHSPVGIATNDWASVTTGDGWVPMKISHSFNQPVTVRLSDPNDIVFAQIVVPGGEQVTVMLFPCAFRVSFRVGNGVVMQGPIKVIPPGSIEANFSLVPADAKP
jgi:hypothetical protein